MHCLEANFDLKALYFSLYVSRSRICWLTDKYKLQFDILWKLSFHPFLKFITKYKCIPSKTWLLQQKNNILLSPTTSVHWSWIFWHAKNIISKGFVGFPAQFWLLLSIFFPLFHLEVPYCWSIFCHTHCKKLRKYTHYVHSVHTVHRNDVTSNHVCSAEVNIPFCCHTGEKGKTGRTRTTRQRSHWNSEPCTPIEISY